MNIYGSFAERIRRVAGPIARAGARGAEIDTGRVVAEPPRDGGHGDVATNAALVLARQAGLAPRELAGRIAAALDAAADIAAVEVAGPGFVNIRLADAFWHDRLREILGRGPRALVPDLAAGGSANVEYVSANPTGPLHVGHARGAVVGDVLATLLETVGYRVTREYYINDAGAQVDRLAWSAYLRYLEALGGTVPEGAFEGLYPGDYLTAVGEALAREHGEALSVAVGATEPGASPLPEPLLPVRRAAVDAMMALIRDDLASLGVRQDVFSSERETMASGAVERCLAALERAGHVYTGVLDAPRGHRPEDWEPVPQTLFRSSAFGDDVDRPLRKSDGAWTYFAPDIAYHAEKVARRFDVLVDVFGADHAGYVKRLKASVAALSAGRVAFDIVVIQLVNLTRGGRPLRMSKRAGRFATVREVVDAVGRDAVRFMMVSRKADMPLDFDLARATEQSRDNPVFYVQYAHARIRSVMRQAAAEGIDLAGLAQADPGPLRDPGELGLIKILARWPAVVETAARTREAHRLTAYLVELASEFHAHWNRGKEDGALRFLAGAETARTRARLALIDAVRQVIAAGLGIVGVEPAEEMR